MRSVCCAITSTAYYDDSYQPVNSILVGSALPLERPYSVHLIQLEVRIIYVFKAEQNKSAPCLLAFCSKATGLERPPRGGLSFPANTVCECPLGAKRTCASAPHMSAFGGLADIMGRHSMVQDQLTLKYERVAKIMKIATINPAIKRIVRCSVLALVGAPNLRDAPADWSRQYERLGLAQS
jgi:hypothetical protein